MDARDEPLVFEFGHAVEGVEDDVAREVLDTGAVHDEEGVPLSVLELPLSFERCGRETCDAAVMRRNVGKCLFNEEVTHASGPMFTSTRLAPLEEMIKSSSIPPSCGGWSAMRKRRPSLLSSS